MCAAANFTASAVRVGEERAWALEPGTRRRASADEDRGKPLAFRHHIYQGSAGHNRETLSPVISLYGRECLFNPPQTRESSKQKSDEGKSRKTCMEDFAMLGTTSNRAVLFDHGRLEIVLTTAWEGRIAINRNGKNRQMGCSVIWNATSGSSPLGSGGMPGRDQNSRQLSGLEVSSLVALRLPGLEWAWCSAAGGGRQHLPVGSNRDITRADIHVSDWQ